MGSVGVQSQGSGHRRKRATTNNGASLIDPDAEMERMGKAGVRAFTWNNAEYPSALKEIYDPPSVKYLKGAFTERDAHGVAVIGTRRATAYGREGLCSAGEGPGHSRHHHHQRAGQRHRRDCPQDTDRGGRPYYSGLGLWTRCGIYGWSQVTGAEDQRTGVLMSEFPLGTKPDARNFPRRNRILSGLSLGVLVVEAPLDSGVMHTVRFALEQGRDVFTIPGSIFSTSSLGSNRLIQDGAKLVTDAADVLEELNISRLEQPPSLPGFSPVEEVEGEEAG